jgi:hypothetical protein
MKKFAATIIAGGLLLSACSNEETKTEDTTAVTETTETTEVEPKEEAKEGGVSVDKGLFNVEVTLPAELFEGGDTETVVANAKQQGIDEATLNEDGSVTYKMSKGKHEELMAELAKSVEEAKTDIVESGDFPSIKEVKTNKDYDKFTISVDREAFENSMDGFATMSIGMVGSYYQAFNGIDAADMKVELDLEDAATGEVFNTIVYPEALEE